MILSEPDSKSINYGRDIFGGIVIALVSIPISMGYAQIAGLPAIYGLYGSVLPIILYGLLTTSRQFVVGVDAMPAVIVGSMLSQAGIAAMSAEALLTVPFITLLTALWFLVLYLLGAGRVVKYISTPVMGGFISGVGMTIILMQIPKLFGGDHGTGEVISLLNNIISQKDCFHPLSFILGLGTVIIILICKKFIPKVPMTVIMMAAGALLQIVFHLTDTVLSLWLMLSRVFQSLVFRVLGLTETVLLHLRCHRQKGFSLIFPI